MSDYERRRFGREGDLSRLLVARLRSGETTLDRVQAAAGLGYAPALEIGVEPAQRRFRERATHGPWAFLSALELRSLAVEFAARVPQSAQGELTLDAIRAALERPSAEAEADVRTEGARAYQMSLSLEESGASRAEVWSLYAASRAANFPPNDAYGWFMVDAAYGARQVAEDLGGRDGEIDERIWQDARIAETLCFGLGGPVASNPGDGRSRRAERDGDLAATIAARLRTGELSVSRAELAAWLGYAPALEVVEPRGPSGQERSGEAGSDVTLALWDGSLTHLELVLLAASFAEHAAGILPRVNDIVWEAISATRAYAAHPCAAHAASTELIDAAIRAEAASLTRLSARSAAPACANSARWAADCATRDWQFRTSGTEPARRGATRELVASAQRAASWAAACARRERVEEEPAWQANQIAEVLCWGFRR